MNIEVVVLADSILRDKAKTFAKKIVFLCREMKMQHKEQVLINQILRSATSIGANIHEAQYAQSANDFISKLEIAQKECYETEYWLELLFETDCISEKDYKTFQNECGTIRRMLISSLKTIKSKKEQEEKSFLFLPLYSYDFVVHLNFRFAKIPLRKA